MATVNMNFPSNSDKSREMSNRPPIEPVVNATSVSSSKRRGKLASAFISPDVSNIGEWILYDVVIPSFKNLLVQALDITLNGGLQSRRTGYTPYSNSYTNYRGVSSGNVYNQNGSSYRYGSVKPQYSEPEPVYNTSDIIDYRNIVINYGNGVDAERESARIVAEIQNEIEQYGKAPVSLLYRLCGITPDWTWERLGWTDPRQIGRKPVPGGYQIMVDNAGPIDV